MAENTESNDPQTEGRAGIPKIAVAFVGVVILVECALAYLLIPSPADVAQAAGVQAADETEGSAEGEGASTAVDKAEPVSEVTLGTFHITLYRPASNTTWRVHLEVAAGVRKEDKEEFDKLFADAENRIRDRIIGVVRSSEVTDFGGEGSGLIKRRILETVNDLFGKPLLREIYFSQNNFNES